MFITCFSIFSEGRKERKEGEEGKKKVFFNFLGKERRGEERRGEERRGEETC